MQFSAYRPKFQHPGTIDSKHHPPALQSTDLFRAPTVSPHRLAFEASIPPSSWVLRRNSLHLKSLFNSIWQELLQPGCPTRNRC